MLKYRAIVLKPQRGRGRDLLHITTRVPEKDIEDLKVMFSRYHSGDIVLEDRVMHANNTMDVRRIIKKEAKMTQLKQDTTESENDFYKAII